MAVKSSTKAATGSTSCSATERRRVRLKLNQALAVTAQRIMSEMRLTNEEMPPVPSISGWQ